MEEQGAHGGRIVMIPAIKKALGSIVGNTTWPNNAAGAGRIYELYLMTALADRLKAAGATVWVQRSDGTKINATDANPVFVQRAGAPSGLPGAGQGANGMSTIAFSLKNSTKIWEIWNGVQFSGRSGAKHEFDIAIVPHDTGTVLRGLSKGGVPFGRPVVAIECKDVSTAGSVDEMRAFIARLYDVTALNHHAQYLTNVCNPLTTIHPGQLPRDTPFSSYRQSNISCGSLIVRRTGFVSGTNALASYYFVTRYGSVTFGSSALNSLLNYLTAWIQMHLA